MHTCNGSSCHYAPQSSDPQAFVPAGGCGCVLCEVHYVGIHAHTCVCSSIAVTAAQAPSLHPADHRPLKCCNASRGSSMFGSVMSLGRPCGCPCMHAPMGVHALSCHACTHWCSMFYARSLCICCRMVLCLRCVWQAMNWLCLCTVILLTTVDPKMCTTLTAVVARSQHKPDAFET